MSLGYLNGEFAPLDRLRISPLDRGFLFGDGVYEVIPVYAGRTFRIAQHLARLERSLAATRIEVTQTRSDWETLLQSLVEGNGGGDQFLYLQVTRGVAPRGHGFPPEAEPSVFAMCLSQASAAGARCVEAITAIDNRWGRCNIKSICLLPNVLLRQQAAESGAAEAILIRDGILTEGAASNVFIVDEGVLRTPPEAPVLLSGVTRGVTIELARESGIEVAEAAISETELRGAGEIWVTSSSLEISAVTRLDGQPVGDGGAGPVWNRLATAFADFKHRYHGS